MRMAYVLVGVMLAAPTGGLAATRGDVFGNALYFDGVDDYVWTAPNVSGAVEGTIELWVRPDGTPLAIWVGGVGHPGTNGDWTRLGHHFSANGFSFGMYAGAWRWAQSGQTLPLGEWTHVAATWGPDGEKLYIGGELAGSSGWTGSVPQYAVDIIGASAWGFGFEGAIDEVRFWNVARDQEAILATMSDIVDPGLQPNLVAYYRFDTLEDLGVGGDGADDVRDLTANGNHGDSEGDVQQVSGAVPVVDQSWGRVKAYFR